MRTLEKYVSKKDLFYCPLNIKYDLGGSLYLQKSAVLQMEYILLGKFLQ